MRKQLLVAAIVLTGALMETPGASGQSAQFVYSNFSGNPAPGSTLSFDIVLNFTAGGSIANLNGLSYWMHEATSPGGEPSLAITLRRETGSLFDDLQSPSLSYPQNLNLINRNANGTQNGTDLGALCSNALPSGSYFIAHVAISISTAALPGLYTVENTTAATAGVGGRISVMNDDQGTTFPITGSNFSFEIPELGTTPTPTPTSTPINISGTISYVSNPIPGPVTLTLTGSGFGSVLSDESSNYLLSSLSSSGSYIVTPTKSALTPGFDGVDIVDVIATLRHYLNIALLSGGRLAAADVNGDGVVNIVDVIAIQRFFLGLTTGIANVGEYKFTPASRAYQDAVSDQTAQDYDALVYGDVAPAAGESAAGPSRSTAGDGPSAGEIPAPVATLSLPNVDVDAVVTNFIVQVTTSAVTAGDRLVGFQGNCTFDERVVSFQSEPVQKAGITGGNWNVSGNVLPGRGPIRTLRISAFSNDFTPLSGSGTLFELRMTKVSKAGQSTHLLWAAPPDQFIFVDSDLNPRRPANAAPGSISTSAKRR